MEWTRSETLALAMHSARNAMDLDCGLETVD